MYELTSGPNKPGAEPCDWHLWLKREGVHMMLQIGYQASKEQVETWVGELVGHPVTATE